jgi:hypothetical protein
MLEGLHMPADMLASCIPDLLPPSTNLKELWEVLSETHEIALKMAEYNETLTAWCKLYASENGVLWNVIHGKQSKPKDHFLIEQSLGLDKARAAC